MCMRRTCVLKVMLVMFALPPAIVLMALVMRALR